MNKISISKQTVMGLGFMVICGILAVLVINTQQIGSAKNVPTAATENTQGLNSAIEGTKAFFDINYHEGKENWLNRFCGFSSEAGCQLVSMGADQLWEKYQDEKVVTLAEILPVAKVAETSNEQVWQLMVKLSAPLPGSNKTEDVASVLVVKKDSKWKFDRFLTKPEIQVIADKATKEVSH